MTWKLGGYGGGAEVAIRLTNWHLSQQFPSESPLMPHCVPQESCHPERQRGISLSIISTSKNRPLKNNP